MQVKALKSFSNAYSGNVVAGDVFDVPDAVAVQMMEYGLVERQAEKRSGPFGGSGQAKQSASSQAAPASPKSKPITSGADAERSQSTPATSEQSGATPSTPVTEHGGSDTKPKRRTRRKGGRKTETQPKGLD